MVYNLIFVGPAKKLFVLKREIKRFRYVNSNGFNNAIRVNERFFFLCLGIYIRLDDPVNHNFIQNIIPGQKFSNN